MEFDGFRELSCDVLSRFLAKLWPISIEGQDFDKPAGYAKLTITRPEIDLEHRMRAVCQNGFSVAAVSDIGP